MLQAFNQLKSLVRLNRRCTETFVFYLHYRVTCLLILFCCILVSTQQFTDKKISCLSKPSSEINTDLLNTYCWAASTYSVRSSYFKQVGIQSPHPGVIGSEDVTEYEYLNFYQYVHIILFIQAFLFYAAHMVWKNVESDLKTFLSNPGVVMKTTEDKSPGEVHINAVAFYVETRWGRFKTLTLKYFFCEILAFLNVLVQSYLLDIFLHGKFLGLGLLLEAYYKSETLSDPIRSFPLVTICYFHRYGPSGYIDVFDSLCVLPINALNAKIFLCLWVWFVFLAILSFLNVVNLLFCIVVPLYRDFQMKVKLAFCREPSENEAYMKLASFGNFGDWFLLLAVRRTMDATDFRNLTNILRKKLIIDVKEPVEIEP